MSTSLTTSPIFTSSLSSAPVDWVDVLGDFLGDEPAHKHQKNSEFSSTPRATSTTNVETDVAHSRTNASGATAPTAEDGVLTFTLSETTVEDDKTNEKSPKLSAAQKAKIRSEKKRTREKQRRTDVNTLFTDLTLLLKKIDSEDCEDDESLKSSVRLSSNMNRVDLIGKTISTLDRLHSVNKKRKCSVNNLSAELEESKKRFEEVSRKLQEFESQPCQDKKPSEPVMMMVPMMVRPDGAAQPAFMPQPMLYPMCAPGAPEKSPEGVMPSYGAMFNPYIVSNQFCPQPNKAADTSNPPMQQHFVPTMLPTQGGVDSESLAYCA